MRQLSGSILALAVVLAWPPNEASAGSTPCENVRDLLEFAANISDLPALGRCPIIQAADYQTLLSSVSFSASSTQHQPSAVYLPTDNVILVGPGVDLSSPLGRSYLVHELLHALQFQAGDPDREPCLGVLEAEAYHAQSAYLKGEGLDEEALLFRSYGLVMASCAQAYHPDFDVD